VVGMVAIVPILVIISFEGMKIFSCAVFIFLLTSYTSKGQSLGKNLSLGFGLNSANPVLVFESENSFVKTIPSWQISLNKDFTFLKAIRINSSLGFSQNLFEAKRIFFRQLNPFYERRRVSLIYVFAECGPSYSYQLKKGSILGGTTIRVSRILNENYNEVFTFPSLENSDLGLNFFLRYSSGKVFIQANYYVGLTKLAKNSIVTSIGVPSENYLRNRSVGIQIGCLFDQLKIRH